MTEISRNGGRPPQNQGPKESLAGSGIRATAPSSFVICTRNRPDDLLRCLTSVVAQSVRPAEAVVVDASDQADEESIRALLAASGVNLQYLRTAPGRTRQLNLGVRASSGDPILFVDDDVELDERFHEMILAAFEQGGQEVGGVQGRIIDDVRPSPLGTAFRAFFLLSRHTKDGAAILLPSGYYTSPAFPTKIQEAQALRLCGLAYRRRVFDEFDFDESLGREGYALKEDVDFSYRVSRRYKLLVTPHARFRHFKTTTSRIAVRQKSRMHIVNNYQLFRKNLDGTPLQWLAFCWAMLGRMIYECGRTVRGRNPDYLLGALEGMQRIVGAQHTPSASHRSNGDLGDS
jgi:GT2 family glycosyltransferase